MFCAAPFLKLDRTIVLFLILFSSSKNLNHQSLHICCKCNKIYINDVFLANKNYALRIYFYNATLVLRMIEVGYETGIKTCKNNKKNAIGIAPGWVILGIGIIAITAISIYALYKDKNIKVTYEKGKVTLETN